MPLFDIEALRSRRRGRRQLPSLAELQQQESLLRAEQQEFGAPSIDEDQPGFLARTIDVLSGWNYALAGATDELGQGNGIAAALGRATTELYSSARSLPLGGLLPELGDPQKEAFGKVFKDLGFETTTLADVFPALEGNFIGELINTRGTVGLAADILTDPLTYLTFGMSSVAKTTATRFAKLGVKKMASKKGVKEMSRIQKRLRGDLPGLTDDEYLTRAAEELLETGSKAMFDPGGAKLAGFVIPGTPGLGKEALDLIGEPLLKAANKFGLGRSIVRTSSSHWDSVKAIYNETFGAFGPLENLPAGPMREAAIRTARKWVPARGNYNAKMRLRVDGSDFMRYFKENPKRVEHVMDVLDEEIPRTFANATEEAAADELSALLLEMAHDGVGAKIFPKSVLSKPSYIFHRYLNDPEEMAEIWTKQRGTVPQVSGKHAKKVIWPTMKQGQRNSKILADIESHGRAAGKVRPLGKELIPDYDIENGLARYIDWFATQKAIRGMTDDFSKGFGAKLDPDDASIRILLESAEDAITETHKDWGRIRGFFGSYKSLKKMSLDEATAFAETGAKQLNTRMEGWAGIVKAANRLLPTLDASAKRQFYYEMFKRVKSPAQALDVMTSFGDDIKYFPGNFNALEGATEDALRVFGEKAVYTQVGGNKMWGKDRALIPRLIVDYVDQADARIFNMDDFKGWRDGVKKWARFNNVFKSWVFPFFPASAFRDKYSNQFLMASRIGWNVLNPKTRAHTMASLSGARGRKALEGLVGEGFETQSGRYYRHTEVNDLMHEHNVLITGAQKAELTADGTYRLTHAKPFSKVVKEDSVGEIIKNIPQPFTRAGRVRAMDIRASIDNTDRAHLFTQGLMDGLTPEEAASTVAEFLFNYNELGGIHRDFIRNLIPFATFSIKNTQLQLKLLRTKPGAVINQLKPFRGESKENESMVKWEAEGLKLRLDGDGKTVRMLTGVDLPLRNLDNLWAGGVGATGRRFIGMMTPLIKAPIEALSRRDMFTGRDITRAQSPAIGRAMEQLNVKWLNDLSGYRKSVDQAGRPKYSFDGVRYQLVVKSFIFSRLVSTTDRQFREYLTGEDTAPARSMLDVMTGLRFKDLNLEDGQRQQLKRRIRQLEESLVRRGRRAQFTRRFQPKDLGEF